MKIVRVAQAYQRLIIRVTSLSIIERLRFVTLIPLIAFRSFPSVLPVRASFSFRACFVLFALAALGSFSSCSSKELSQDEFASFQKAQALYGERKFDEARDILDSLLDKHSDSVEVGVLLARTYFFTRDFEKSETTLRDLLKKREHSPYALLWLGRIVASDPKRQAEAADVFRSVLKEDPENFAAHYYLGRCLEGQGKIEEALLSYQRSVAVEYPLSKMHLHIGTVFQDMKMQDRATAHFRRVEQLGMYPDDIAWIKKQSKAKNANLAEQELP